MVAHRLCSGRAACRILRLSRATFYYRAPAPSPRQVRLAARLRELSEAHPRHGYRRVAALLRREGWAVGKRQVQRLRRAESLRVPPTRRKLVRQGISTGLPTKATRRGHVWTWDFISDATVRGGALKMGVRWHEPWQWQDTEAVHQPWADHVAKKRAGQVSRRPVADVFIEAFARRFQGLITRNPKHFASVTTVVP